MKSLATLLAFVSLTALGAAPAVAADPPAPIDRTLYPGSHRLTDAELRLFLEHWGHYFRPGMRIPLWSERWLDRFRVGFASGARFGGGTANAVGPNVSVSNDPSQVHSESFIAVDRGNPRRLVGGSNQITDNPQMMFWSEDGGNSWGSVPMPLGGATFHSDPGVAWDSNGVAYGCSLGISSTTEVQVVRSSDGGKTWSSPPIVINSSPGNDKELMAANDQPGTPCQDLVCVAWDEVTGGGSNLKVACATAAQGAWTERTVAIGGLIGAIPAFGPDGELYVAWSNIDGTSIDFVRSDDCGNSYSVAAPVAQTRIGYDLGIPAMCNRRALIYPAIDVDRTAGPSRGQIYAVWTDAAPGSTCPANRCSTACNANVYFARSADGGLSWSAPITVHEDLPGTDQFNPWLAVNDSDGSVNVMWYDTRGDVNREQTNVWYRRSPNGGLNWDPEVQVTTAPTDETAPGADTWNEYGDYNGLAAFQCAAWPIWTDRRSGGNEQIFTAAVTSGPTTGGPPDVGNTLLGVAGAGRVPEFSWRDLDATETDYRIYRGDDPDFSTVAPTPLGLSGGPDTVVYVDATAPTTPGVWFYKVRALGPCGEEASSW